MEKDVASTAGTTSSVQLCLVTLYRLNLVPRFSLAPYGQVGESIGNEVGINLPMNVLKHRLLP